MPTRLKSKRGTTAFLTPTERSRIKGWFMEGFTAAEVYHKCMDDGFLPPSEQSLYLLRRSSEVQDVLRARQQNERHHRITSLVERTRVRDQLVTKIESTFAQRATEYGSRANDGTPVVPGGSTGLVTLVDVKSVISAKRGAETEYTTVEIHKADTALIAELRQVLNDQDDSDERLRKGLRASEEHRLRLEALAQQLEINGNQLEVSEIEVDRARAMQDEQERLRIQSQAGVYLGDPTLPDNHRTY